MTAINKAGTGSISNLPNQEVGDLSKSGGVESTGTSKTDTASSASNASTSGTPSSSKKEPEDSKATARAAQGSKQNATEQKSQNNVQAQIVQKNLQNQIAAAKSGRAYTAAHFAADAAKASAKAVGGANADAVQRGNEKASTTVKLEHEKLHAKSTLKTPEGTLWDSVKSAARFASDTAKAGTSALDHITASAYAPDLAAKTNQLVRDGYSKALTLKGEQLAAEVKRVGSGNASFEEKEQLIHSIDAFRREATETELSHSGLYSQETQKPPRMVDKEIMGVTIQVKSQFQEDYSDRSKGGLTEILGPYGYHNTLKQGVEGLHTQKEILDASLHNWRSTPKEIRQKVDSGEMHPIKLSDSKYWKTPPDTRLADRAAEGGQLVFENSGQPAWFQGKKFTLDSPGVSPDPFNGQVKDRPDYDQAEAQYKHDVIQSGLDVINSTGLTHGTPTLESPGSGIVEGHRAPAPAQNLAETQPGPMKSSNAPRTTNTTDVPQSTSPRPPSSESVKGAADSNSSARNSQKSEPNTDVAKKPQVQNRYGIMEEGWRKLQQRSVEEAIGGLDEGRLTALRDILRDNKLLDRPNNRPRNDGIALQDEKIREQRGINLPGERASLLREIREALENSTDPRVTELLENDPQGRVIQEELRELDDARNEEAAEVQRRKESRRR